MIVEAAALIAVVVLAGAQLVRIVAGYREHRAARQRAEQLLDRHLARHDGGPPSNVRRLEAHEWGYEQWHG